MLSSRLQRSQPISLAPAGLERWALDDPRWRRFVESQPEATAFHHPAWSSVLSGSYGHQGFVLALRADDGRVLAGLPILALQGMRKRPGLQALPFTDYSPPLASSSVSLALFSKSLAGWCRAEAGTRLVVHGELANVSGVSLISRSVRHVLPLSCSSDHAFDRLLSGSVRRAIRKAQRDGVETRISQSQEDLATFYRLHVQTRRRLGVPVQPRRFIAQIGDKMVRSGLGFVVVASHHERPIAAALFLAWNRNLIYKFGASDPRYWPLRPNNLVVWTAIDWACRQGYRLLDFGVTDSTNQGLKDFKYRWGATELPLMYSYVGPPSSPMPATPPWPLARLIRSSPPVVCRLLGELYYQYLVPNLG